MLQLQVLKHMLDQLMVKIVAADSRNAFRRNDMVDVLIERN